eukprot:Opistho-1_new@55794
MDAGVRRDDLEYAREALAVLLAERVDDLLVALLPAKQLLDVEVLTNEHRKHRLHVATDAAAVPLDERDDGLDDHEKLRAVLLRGQRRGVLVDRPRNLLRRERAEHRIDAVAVVRQERIDPREQRHGQSRRQRREHFLELEHGQAGVLQRRHKLRNPVAQLVIADEVGELVPGHNVLERRLRRAEHLVGARTHELRVAKVREGAAVYVDPLHARRVVEDERRDDVPGLEDGTLLLRLVKDAAVAGHEGHDHLHHLNLGKGLAGAHVLALADQIAHQLAGGARAQLRRVILLVEDARLAVERHAIAVDLFLHVRHVRLPAKHDEGSAVAELVHVDLHKRPVHREDEAVRSTARRLNDVLRVAVDQLDDGAVLEEVAAEHLAALERAQVRLEAVLNLEVRDVYGAAHHRKHSVRTLRGHLLADNPCTLR